MFGANFLYLMKIRRATYHQNVNNKDFIKSLALLCYLKNKFPSSAIPDYTLGKIHRLTGLHSVTCKKRINTLKSLGFAKIATTKSGKTLLILNNISSKHQQRNIDLNCVVFDTVKSVEQSLYALYIVEVQNRKEYVKQTIYEAHNSYSLKKLKEAKKRCRSYRDEFVDNGLSYKGIAKRLKISLQKALSIVSFATKFEFIVKIKRQIQQYCRDAVRRFEYAKNDVMKFTFCTRNNLYVVLANQYKVGERLKTTIG